MTCQWSARGSGQRAEETANANAKARQNLICSIEKEDERLGVIFFFLPNASMYLLAGMVSLDLFLGAAVGHEPQQARDRRDDEDADA